MMSESDLFLFHFYLFIHLFIVSFVIVGYKINIGTVKIYARSNLIYFFCLTTAFYTKKSCFVAIFLKFLE